MCIYNICMYTYIYICTYTHFYIHEFRMLRIWETPWQNGCLCRVPFRTPIANRIHTHARTHTYMLQSWIGWEEGVHVTLWLSEGVGPARDEVLFISTKTPNLSCCLEHSSQFLMLVSSGNSNNYCRNWTESGKVISKKLLFNKCIFLRLSPQFDYIPSTNW